MSGGQNSSHPCLFARASDLFEDLLAKRQKALRAFALFDALFLEGG